MSAKPFTKICQLSTIAIPLNAQTTINSQLERGAMRTSVNDVRLRSIGWRHRVTSQRLLILIMN